MQASTEKFNLQRYKQDFKEGLAYLKAEKGLMVITIYFFLTMFASGASSTVIMPYFKATPSLGIQLYSYVMAFGVFGRLIGGLVQYKFRYPVHKKFHIAMFVYVAISVLEGVYLYFPVVMMMVLCFIGGVLSVTSYNIRISSTQNYVPDANRGRFNGIFLMFCTLGMIAGQLLSGFIAEWVSGRLVQLIFMSLNLIGTFLIMFRGRKHVKLIYNREL